MRAHSFLHFAQILGIDLADHDSAPLHVVLEHDIRFNGMQFDIHMLVGQELDLVLDVLGHYEGIGDQMLGVDCRHRNCI